MTLNIHTYKKIYIHISHISIGTVSYWISKLPISEGMSISIPTTWPSSLKLDMCVTYSQCEVYQNTHKQR